MNYACSESYHPFLLRRPMTEPNWNDLPLELLIKVAECAGPGCAAMKALRSLSSEWKTTCEAAATGLVIKGSSLCLGLTSRFYSLASLDLEYCIEVSPESMGSLRALRSLTSLKMNFDHLTEAAVEPLLELPLKSLEVRQWGTLERTLASLEGPAGLTHVTLIFQFDEYFSPMGYFHQAVAALKRMPFTSLEFENDYHSREQEQWDFDVLKGMPLKLLDLGFQHQSSFAFLDLMQSLPSLNSLNLGKSFPNYRNERPGAYLEALRGLPLTSLDLGDEKWFTAEDVEVLRSLPLTHLCFGESSVPVETLGIIREISSLASLDFGSDSNQFTNEHLAALEGLQLTHLDFGLKRYSDWKISDSGLEVLVGMPLKDLTLFQDFTDAGMVHLLNLPLTSIYFYRSKITDAGLASVGRLLLLTRLELIGCNVTDVGLEFLQGLPLRYLNLYYAKKITDRGLEFLHGMPMQHLNLDGTQITAAGLKALESLPLKKLWVSDCKNLDPQDVTDIWLQSKDMFHPISRLTSLTFRLNASSV